MHATVAGVLLALAVPLGRPHDTETLKAELAAELGGTDFEDVEVRLDHLENVIDRAQSPLHEFEHALQPWVAYVIMPVFALFNAGVTLGGEGGGFANAVTLGAFLGLLLGKPVGITLFVASPSSSASPACPAGVGWAAIAGVGLLGGIGFTMALFIAMLAFGESARARPGQDRRARRLGRGGAGRARLPPRRPARGQADGRVPTPAVRAAEAGSLTSTLPHPRKGGGN